MMEHIQTWLMNQGISQMYVSWIMNTIEVVVLILVAIVANLIAKRYIVATVTHFLKNTKNTWDDLLIEYNVFTRLSHLAPAFIIFFGIDLIFPESPQIIQVVHRLANAYMIIIGASVLSSILNVVLDAYQRFDVSNRKPIKGYVQAVKLFVYLFAALFVLSTLLNKSPWGFLSVLGGLTAVLLLIFKDTILGLVASVQIMANNMVARGDWIEMPKYGADGDVLDITLTTVKVQNWDKTISTIPTYALITDSFKNWRGMSESGGRRIKRSVSLDMNTIKFVDGDLLARLQKIDILKEYLQGKLEDVNKYNEEKQSDLTSNVNGRRLTNVGTFRAYIIQYLKNHPDIHQEGMTFLVRQLKPTEFGLPIEIYVFSKDQVWANYEAIQADIFDHILAVVHEFDLSIYQQPSGRDLKEIPLT